MTFTGSFNERLLNHSNESSLDMSRVYTCMLRAHALEFEWARMFTKMVMKGFVNVRLSNLVSIQNNVHLNVYLNVYLIAQLNVLVNVHLNLHLNGHDARNTPQYVALFLTTLAFHNQQHNCVTISLLVVHRLSEFEYATIFTASSVQNNAIIDVVRRNQPTNL